MELQVFQSEIFEKNFNLNKQFFLQKRPVVVKNDRYVGGGFVFFEILGLDTCVLRRKFSATKFWKDCIDNNCTVC